MKIFSSSQLALMLALR